MRLGLKDDGHRRALAQLPGLAARLGKQEALAAAGFGIAGRAPFGSADRSPYEAFLEHQLPAMEQLREQLPPTREYGRVYSPAVRAQALELLPRIWPAYGLYSASSNFGVPLTEEYFSRFYQEWMSNIPAAAFDAAGTGAVGSSHFHKEVRASYVQWKPVLRRAAGWSGRIGELRDAAKHLVDMVDKAGVLRPGVGARVVLQLGEAPSGAAVVDALAPLFPAPAAPASGAGQTRRTVRGAAVAVPPMPRR